MTRCKAFLKTNRGRYFSEWNRLCRPFSKGGDASKWIKQTPLLHPGQPLILFDEKNETKQAYIHTKRKDKKEGDVADR